MVKSTGITRKIDELGRMVLPKEIRDFMGICDRDALEFMLDEERNLVVIRKATRMCLRCRATGDLKTIRQGYYLCGRCLEELRQA